VASNLNTHQKDPVVVIQAMLEISSIVQLDRILNKIKALPTVIEARKQTH
jgi:(p)ppGpp synthase/HD superfamily hydrolase